MVALETWLSPVSGDKGGAMAITVAAQLEIEPSKRERLRQIIAERCYRRGRFKLASGKESDYYFNLKPAMLDPEGANLLADLMLERIAGLDAKYIGGLAMGAVPVAIATMMRSYATAKPLQAFWVRKEGPKEHGAKNLADGYIVSGERVIVVEDVTTTGDSVMHAIDEVRRRGCEIAAVITIVDRLEGAQKRLAREGIGLIALYTTKDFDPDFDPEAHG
jgi:orotate phosphoribosyltransferase